MFPYLRLLKVLAMSRRRKRLGPFEDSVVSFRVWPGDLDQNRHLNNGRYLTMMDLGRFDLIGRLGMLPALLKRRWHPVVTGATIRFRRSLDPFQKYQLCTRLLGWDEQGMYLEQRFERDGKVLAIGMIRGVFLGPEGRIAPETIVELVAPGTRSPPLPDWVETWKRSQNELADELRKAPPG